MLDYGAACCLRRYRPSRTSIPNRSRQQPSGVDIEPLRTTSTCDPRPLRGTVAKRQFDDDRVTVAGFILEFPDGSRHFIGIDLDTQGLTLNASGWVIRGLQTLLTQGNVVDVTVKSCDGYLAMLDAVLEVPPERPLPVAEDRPE